MSATTLIQRAAHAAVFQKQHGDVRSLRILFRTSERIASLKTDEKCISRHFTAIAPSVSCMEHEEFRLLMDSTAR